MARVTTGRPAPASSDEKLQLAHVRDDLRREFPTVPGEVVDSQVTQVEQTFTRAPIRSFVPVLVQRGARDRLRQLA